MTEIEKLNRKIASMGWFSKELVVEIKIKREFEGFYGRASEDWETQYEFHSNEILADSKEVMFPKIDAKSKRHENLDDFLRRVNNTFQMYS